MEQVEAILFNELLHVFAHALHSLLVSLQCLVLAFLAGLSDHIAQRDVEQLRNRVRMLQNEEMRAMKKIEETKKKTREL